MLFLGCKYLGTIWIKGFTLHRAMISLFLTVDIEALFSIFYFLILCYLTITEVDIRYTKLILRYYLSAVPNHDRINHHYLIKYINILQ